MLPETIDRYQILAEAGHGGMAVVYRAFDPQRKQTVALKVLPREYLHDPQFRARFKREIDIHSNFHHAAVVPIYGYGQFQGLLYLVMDYMPGGSLGDRLQQRKTLSIAEVVAVLARIAPALDEAHRQGIIHRDLKPSNILFDENGQAYLCDFGIARLAEQASQLTGNAMIGSPAYMSPEQARTGIALDKLSDLYSLGVMVFEMLTGTVPYTDTNRVKIALKHITDPIPDILAVNPDLPAECQAFIDKALAKEPSERFTSAADMTESLGVLARPGRAPVQASRSVQPRPLSDAGTPPARPAGLAPDKMAAPRREAAPERTPTPRPLNPVNLQQHIPIPQAPVLPKTWSTRYLRPISRYLRLPSWLRAPSVPYIQLPPPIARVLGTLGISSSIAIPKKLPGGLFVVLIILIVLAVLAILAFACYKLVFVGLLNSFAPSWVILSLVRWQCGAKIDFAD